MLTLFFFFFIIINRKDTKFTKVQNFAGGSGAYTVLERRVNAGARLKDCSPPAPPLKAGG